MILGELDTNCYLVYADNGEGVLIDPADDAETILETIQKKNVSLKAVVLTHVHFDHMLAAQQVCEITKAPLYVGAGDEPALSDPKRNLSKWFNGSVVISGDGVLREGDVLTIGEETLTVMETPGHTPGCICLYVENILFSGDTLFESSIGRLDFPGGNAQAMADSLKRLKKLPEDTAVYSGHGPATTIGREIKLNPYLQ